LLNIWLLQQQQQQQQQQQAIIKVWFRNQRICNRNIFMEPINVDQRGVTLA
jgi:hypothetical protein